MSNCPGCVYFSLHGFDICECGCCPECCGKCDGCGECGWIQHCSCDIDDDDDFITEDDKDYENFLRKPRNQETTSS